MNTLSNGAVAVGSPGSWMRFQCAYEHELEKAYAEGRLRLFGDQTISDRAEKMMEAILRGNVILSKAMQNAAIACGIKPTLKDIQIYLRKAKGL